MGTSLFIIGSKALMREKQNSLRYYQKSRDMFDDISWMKKKINIAQAYKLQKENIPCSNCTGFATDNASVMVGRHNGVAVVKHLKY